MTSHTTFGSMFSEPDMSPPYAASFADDATWSVVNHREGGKVIVAGLTEAQALKIAASLNTTTSP